MLFFMTLTRMFFVFSSFYLHSARVSIGEGFVSFQLFTFAVVCAASTTQQLVEKWIRRYWNCMKNMDFCHAHQKKKRISTIQSYHINVPRFPIYRVAVFHLYLYSACFGPLGWRPLLRHDTTKLQHCHCRHHHHSCDLLFGTIPASPLNYINIRFITTALLSVAALCRAVAAIYSISPHSFNAANPKSSEHIYHLIQTMCVCVCLCVIASYYAHNTKYKDI